MEMKTKKKTLQRMQVKKDREAYSTPDDNANLTNPMNRDPHSEVKCESHSEVKCESQDNSRKRRNIATIEISESLPSDIVNRREYPARQEEIIRRNQDLLV